MPMELERLGDEGPETLEETVPNVQSDSTSNNRKVKQEVNWSDVTKLKQFNIGDEVDVLDSSGRWCEALVNIVDIVDIVDTMISIFVHFVLDSKT